MEETTQLIGIQAYQELGAGSCRRGLGVGRRESVVGHGDVVVQGVDVGGEWSAGVPWMDRGARGAESG